MPFRPLALSEGTLINDPFICRPITSQVKGYPFEVSLDEVPGMAGVVLADRVKSLDWKARKAKHKGRVTRRVAEEALGKLHTLL